MSELDEHFEQEQQDDHDHDIQLQQEQQDDHGEHHFQQQQEYNHHFQPEELVQIIHQEAVTDVTQLVQIAFENAIEQTQEENEIAEDTSNAQEELEIVGEGSESILAGGDSLFIGNVPAEEVSHTENLKRKGEFDVFESTPKPRAKKSRNRHGKDSGTKSGLRTSQPAPETFDVDTVETQNETPRSYPKKRKNAPRSVLDMGGEVGKKIRENFCRLVNNKEGPGFVTCRQCILQVNRARVFRDNKDDLHNLLNHVQIHEDVLKGVENSPVIRKACAQFEETRKTPVEKSPKSSLSKVTINAHIPGEEQPGTSEFNTDPDPVVLDEHYNCSHCKTIFVNFEEFITHSVAMHNRTVFNVTFGQKDDEKDPEKVVRDENASLSPVNIDDDDAKIRRELAETSQKLERQVRVKPTARNLNMEHITAENSSAVMGVEGLNAMENVLEEGSDAIYTGEVTVSTKKLRKPTSKAKVMVEFIEECEDPPIRMVKVTDEALGPFVCIECGNGTKDCVTLRDHMTNMHGDRSRVFGCKTCTKSWSEKNFYQFEEHMTQCHPLEEVACFFCRLSFQNCTDLRYHVAQHRPPLNFCCAFCYHEFSWILETEFSNHVMRHMNVDKPYQCNECQEHFTDFVERREHQTAHDHDVDLRKFHDELRPFICTGCGKQFNTTPKTPGVRALRQHVCQSGVTMDPRFECKYCKCLFPLARSLRNHMRQKHENHMCHLCGLVCKSKPALDEHVGSEHYDSQFPCPVCLETFDTSQKMKQHRTREHVSRDFICEFCGQGFAAKLLLVRHLKKHEEFRGFHCSVCNDKFLLADRLETHFRKYHSHVVSDQEYETIVLDHNVQTAIAAETIAIIQE